MSETERVTCSECGSGFSKSSNLYRHYRTKHGIQQQVCGGGGGVVCCPHCPQTFSKKSNMYRHCLQVHKVHITSRVQSGDSSDCCEESTLRQISATTALHEMMEAVLMMASSLADEDLSTVVERARRLDSTAKRLLETDVT